MGRCATIIGVLGSVHMPDPGDPAGVQAIEQLSDRACTR
jgi:hypothetical protein